MPLSRQIPLSQGQFALVDADDYESLSQFKWHAWWNKNTSSFYARRHSKKPGDPALVYMHREIMQAGKGTKVDHKSRETLDNRRDNLRFATNSQNQWNRAKNANNTSGFKGVFWHKEIRKWVAGIGVDGRYRYLGCFTDPAVAYEAYRQAARELHGEFACAG